ncbi:MAG: hypothetical protein HZA04_10610 [Nitrospinae bacterium]|nr:hypothetical protein [Nitrospinota bacterium]
MKKLIASLIAASLASVPAYAVDLHGRVSEAVFYLTDDATVQNYNFTRTRLALEATNFDGEDNTFRFDGSYRTKSSYDYNTRTPDTRIDVMNVEMLKAFTDTDVTIGRQYIESLVGARVDGALLNLHLDAAKGAGFFGGTAPDPYNDDLTSAFTTYGAYGYWKEKDGGVTAGYATSLYKGKEDLAYLFGSAYLTPDDELSMYGSVRLDHNITAQNGYDITNLLLTANYRWGWEARVNLTLNQYRGLWMQESMDYNVTHEMQRSARVYADYSLSRSSKVYGQFDYRTRDSDDKSASLYGIGYRDSELWGALFYNVGYRGINYFTSKSWQVYVSGGAQPRDDLTAELGVSYLNNTQDKPENSMTQMVYTASANWLVSKSLYFNGVVEYSTEKFLSVDSVYLAKYKDEYKSTAIWANLDYRF